MDEAAIFTIHGWSSRMLRQHAFDSASLFQQTRVEDGETIKLVAVRDYWRRWFYPLATEQLAAIDSIAKSPEDLLRLLEGHWRVAERGPGAQAHAGPTPDVLLAHWSEWQGELQRLESRARELWLKHREALHVQLTAAMNTVLHGGTYRVADRSAYLAQMDEWSVGAQALDQKSLNRFTNSTLKERTKQNCKTPEDQFGVFAAIEALLEHQSAEPKVAVEIEAHAAWEIGQAYRRRKGELAQFDFQDLLQRLYYALQADDGRLAAAIRAQYPVALVDEFQDTDPWQYGALLRIYGTPGHTALVMIGDPKQAIYGFRGADLATYMRARGDAHAIHTLNGNYRSTAGVVAAVNHVFGIARLPFGDVPFKPVTASNPKVQPILLQDGACTSEHPAMTVMHFASEGPLGRPAYQHRMAEVFASRMVDLLNAGVAVPRDMAVLVRDRDEARSIRRALSARGVRSVYLSESDSVFDTSEAQDLWRILRAVAQPRSTGLLRAALVTRLWGKPWPELDALITEEDAWEAVVEDFHRWQKTWTRQGFLPMLHQLLHEQSIPSRLLALEDGERRLTNVLHLGDLLQAASIALQGEHALIRHLEDELPRSGSRRGSGSNEAAQLRLESDAHLVQVVTMHKSKGLQYPLVFLPFVSNFREAKAGEGRSDTERLEEDVRLFYVALTRAERALWLGVANRSRDFTQKATVGKSSISRLLGRQSADDLAERLQGWSACPQIDLQQASEPARALYRMQTVPSKLRDASVVTRRLHVNWWIASFSALTRDLASTGSVPASAITERDERLEDAQRDSGLPASDAMQMLPAAVLKYNQFPAGSAYGTLLHDLLEWQAIRGWPCAHQKSEHDKDWQQLLNRFCERFEFDDSVRLQLDAWIARVVTTALPLGDNEQHGTAALTLSRLGDSTAWPEMAFSFPVHQLSAQTLDAITQAHVLPGEKRDALEPRVLSGMLTGLMDLVFEHAGRFYVLDYKSNKLEGYASPQLAASILAHRYDVQYTLYVLALHRLLQARHPDYDYDQHVGGALYLFLRGIEEPGAGVYLHKPPRALIEELDAAFSSQSQCEGVGA
jgi:exodeoxyribonuclease V beta subunit